MSGDKIEELVYRASLKEGFEDAVKGLRDKYDIPTEGYQSEKETKDWYYTRASKTVEYFVEGNPNVIERTVSFETSIEQILKEFDLPASAERLITHYVICDNKFPLDNNDFLCALDFPHQNKGSYFSEEARWIQKGEGYVKMLIHKDASKEDVKKFLDKNWSQVQWMLGNFGKKKQRIRKSKNKERDTLIFTLWNKSKADLGGGSTKTSKDILVAREMKKRGYSSVTEDIVRKVAQKQRELRGEV